MTAKREKSWMASYLMCVLLLSTLTAIPVRADVSQELENGHPEVADQLSLFKQTAWEMSKHAYTLDAMTPSRQLDWRSHSQTLETLKEQVNSLGRTLTNLEQLKDQANEGQRMAIVNARPPLVATAQQLSQAIDLLADDRRSVYFQPYSETVSNLSVHAASVYETVDTIMDYENAKMRLLDLDLSTWSEGS